MKVKTEVKKGSDRPDLEVRRTVKAEEKGSMKAITTETEVTPQASTSTNGVDAGDGKGKSMNAKSEPKKQLYESKEKTAPPLPTNWYAEDVKHELDKHNQTCTDPKCTHNFALHWKDTKTVAMLKTGEPKKIFLALFGEGAIHPYAPYQVLNLATGDEIASLFDDQGRVECMVTGHSENLPVCLTLLCHQKSIDISVGDSDPDSITLVCAEPSCREPIRFPGFNGTVKLAPKPETKYPYMHCSVHGVQMSYFICKHVRDGAIPHVLFRPTQEDGGLAVCSDKCWKLFDKACKENDAENPNFGPACFTHLNEIRGGKLEQYHQKTEAA